jgi:hypothetical protein
MTPTTTTAPAHRGHARRLRMLAALLGLGLAAVASAQTTVGFTPTVGCPTFAKRDTVLRVAPGTLVETHLSPSGGGARD